MTQKGRVAIFQGEYAVHAPSGYTALLLAKQGYQVDFFLFNVSCQWFGIENGDAIRIYSYQQPVHAGEWVTIPDKVVQASLEEVKSKRYRCFIGLESLGLIWAGLINEQIDKVPLLYHSLELYTSDYYIYPYPRALAIKAAERKYHPTVAATIIQDEERAKILLRDNQVGPMPVLFVPVGLWGPPKQSKGTWLRDRYNIDPAHKIILYFGELCTERFTDHLVAAAQFFPANWRLVLHCGDGGHTSWVFFDTLRKLDYQQRTIISTENVPFEQIDELIASADLGLAFYRNVPLNEYHTGLSSEKLALYFKSGLPVIASNFPSIKQVIERYQCGICIDWFNQLAGAAQTIFDDYTKYSKNTHQCYRELYQVQTQYQKVIDFIELLPL